jgi:2-polyprenyl-6-methoxyphenol hydroxylase-like FAD-dependent oxidoreductase
MELPAHCDVLIVGAGPTGLMLANELARRGIDSLIIDRHAGPARETRALGVQARTMEIYAQLGLAERALELGKRATGANLWARGRRTARVPLGDIGQGLSPFPFLLILGQDDNERLLGDALRRQGRDVRWNTELVGLEQRAGGVSAVLTQPDGSKRTISASWIGGCDGARSAVRELNGIAFPGAPYQHVFFVADTTATGPMMPDELNVFLLSDGFHLFFPMRGKDHWRVVGILPPELRDRDGLVFDEVAPSVRSHVGTGLEFSECRWFSTYRIHHRRAERFRKGRCFLLGDAAHIHSPVGAQGMNTGLQDAYNLAWKLALVVSGRAGEPLLDSYAAEREPVAERLLQTTDRAFAFIVSDGWSSRLLRTRILARVAALAMSFDVARKLAFRTISQTGIQYRDGPLSQNRADLPEGGPSAGDRFPWMKLNFAAGGPEEDLYSRLDGTRFNLIVIGQPAPTAPASLGDLVKVHEISSDGVNGRVLERARIPAVSFFLLRPDGYVGLAGNRVDATTLQRYWSERLALATDR